MGLFDLTMAYGRLCAVFLFWGIMLFGLATVAVARWKWQVHRVYGLLALGFGVAFLFLMPIYSVPDEKAHFANAYATSNVYTFDTHNGGVETRRYSEWFPSYAQIYVDRDGFDRFFASFGGEENHMEYPWFDEDRYDAPLALYAVSGLGIALARVAGLNSGWLFILGQFFNLLLFTAAMTYGIYRMPYGKRMLCVFGLLPMTVQLSASYSYDVELLAAAVLVLSISFYYGIGQPQRMYKRDIVLFFLSAWLLLIAKGHVYVFMLLVPVVLAAKKEWMLPQKRKRWIIGAVIVLAAVTLWWTLLGGGRAVLSWLTAVPYIRRLDAEGYSPLYYLLHPGYTLPLYVRTFFAMGSHYVFQMLGGAFGSFQIYIWTPFVYLLLLWLLAASVRREGEPALPASRRVALLVLMLLMDFLASFAMALYETEKNAVIIAGFQGRYLLPTLPGILLGLFFWKHPTLPDKIPESVFPLISGVLLYVAALNYLVLIP